MGLCFHKNRFLMQHLIPYDQLDKSVFFVKSDLSLWCTFGTPREPCHEKTYNVVSEQVRHKHRRWLEAGNFGFRKQRNCTTHVGKTKAMISFAVTVKLICNFVFTSAKCWFSHDVAHAVVIAL